MSKAKRTLERERLEALSDRLRSVVLKCYIRFNAYHDAPGWSELDDFGRQTWARVAAAMLDDGWVPPDVKMAAASVGLPEVEKEPEQEATP